MLHTILGAGGPIANALTDALLQANQPTRLVSRKEITRFKAPWQGADLLERDQLRRAVQGSSVIYMCAGLRYDHTIWASQWPVIIDNLISVTRETKARLIFFDNVYMYGKVDGPMTESTPYVPCSVKGRIRAKIAQQLMEEAKYGNIVATIARAADFYGAESLNSFYDSMVLAKYAKGEKAMWLGNPETLHSFTYVADAGKAMYLLGQTPSADNQTWHVPTAPPLSGREFINMAAETFGVKNNYLKVNKFMLKGIGLFNKMIGETAEMYYQYQHDYNFNSDKFVKAFNMKPTPYDQGIKHLSETLFRKGG